jgi:ABC-type Fe3+-hydroxamate transport system substrate-binding protein
MILLIIPSCQEKVKDDVSVSDYVLDDLERKIRLDNPEKIVSLAPNLTEMIFLLGEGENLVGNTTYCDFPQEAEEVEKVGDLITVNFELIIDLKPDIIFMTVEGNTKNTFDKLIELGLEVFVSNPRDYYGIKKTLSDIAKILGKERFAEQLSVEWESRVRKIQKSFSSAKNRRSVMFLVEVQPIMIAGESTFLNEYIKFCNLENISANSDINYPIYSREEILKIDPDLIIYPSEMSYDKHEVLNLYSEWRELKAFRKGNIIIVDSDLYFRPGPRFVTALEDFSKKIYKIAN